MRSKAGCAIMLVEKVMAMRLRAIGVRVLSLVVVVVASVTVTVAPAGGSAQTGAAGNGLIAFTRAEGDAEVIYVMRADGSGVHPLRRGVLGFDLAWSPDGSKLAFVGSGGGGHLGPSGGIWVVHADGTNLQSVLKGRTGSPTWSPDGRRLAFNRLLFDIWVANTDGSNAKRLRTNPGGGASVDWSPAGGRLAFSFFDYYPAVYVMDARGRDVHRLAPGSQPDWSPDGRRIAFIKRRGDGSAPEIFVMASDGRNVRRVVQGSEPEWSPDGRKIAFVRGDPSLGSGEIYVVNADGTGLKRLTHGDNGGTARSPAWQPIPRAQ